MDNIKISQKEKRNIIIAVIIIIVSLFAFSIGWRSKPSVDCKAEAFRVADYVEDQLDNSDQFYKTIPYYKVIAENVDTLKYYYFTYKSVSRQVLENHIEAALVNVTEEKNG